MKKTIFFIFILLISVVIFAADDVEIVLSGNTSTDHFAVKDNSSNTLFMVRGNSVINIPTLSSAPSSASEGDLYTNSSTNKIYYYDGTNWLDLTSVAETDPTLTDDQYVTIGDSGSNPIQLIFDGNTVYDGLIQWDPNNSSFSFINNATPLTTLQILANGIVNIPAQSGARAYQYDGSVQNPTKGQYIPFNQWTAVYYQNLNYDKQGEFTTSNISGNSFFTVSEPGYYQINARLDFILIDEDDNVVVNPNYPGYVSIAIYDRSSSSMLSQGNKLQGADNNGGGWNDLMNNLAPNISDVLYLSRGQQIEIRAYQNLYNSTNPGGIGIPLRNTEQNGVTETPPGSPQVYVSIHKIS